MTTTNAAPSFFRYDPDDSHWYRPSRPLRVAVNTAIAADQALLVTGEPGTGKTVLAHSIAEVLGVGPVLPFYTRSDHQARDCLYTFDGLSRFYDTQAGDKDAKDPKNYRRLEALGRAIESRTRRVVLVDEIDKAPRDFPNDLLHVVEALEFEVRETKEEYKSSPDERPLLVITTNSEKPLPDAFLRRCVFHYIEFPEKDDLRKIVDAQLRTWKLSTEGVSKGLLDRVVERFLKIRSLPDLEKKPATAELLVWLRVLVRAGVSEKDVEQALPRDLYLGALLKTQTDLKRVQALEASG